MTNTRRTLTEIFIVVILALLAYALWQWQENRRGRELEEQATSNQEAIEDLRNKASFWADGLAASEAQAVFRAFLAGASPEILAGRDQSAQEAATQLLTLPAVDFVHILRPDGTVVYTSDAKLTAVGNRLTTRDWVLTVTELSTRASETRGVTELASPILGPEGPVAYLWLGYRTEALLEEMRPEAF